MMYFPTASIGKNSARVLLPFSSLLSIGLIQGPPPPHACHSPRKCLRLSEKGHETLPKRGFYPSGLICLKANQQPKQTWRWWWREKQVRPKRRMGRDEGIQDE